MTTKRKILIHLLFLAGIMDLTKSVLDPEDEDFFGYEADRYDWSKHPCRRRCIDGQEPKICKYLFVIEQYTSMSKACYDCPYNLTDCSRPHCIPADGSVKTIYVANRQIPGPLIEVCEGDTIAVEVRNVMLSESTTIHWHGFKQYGTPYMDGVPMVSQCPILPGDTFRYVFKATTTGTFFWHSHIGNQRSDGLFGGMVVNQYVSKNIYLTDYDHDYHQMILSDWSQQTGDTGMQREYDWFANQTPTNIIINGLGPYEKFKTDDGNTVYTPYTIFEVTKGERHRIRVVNAGSGDCPIEVSIDEHPLFIISLDSNDIRAVEVNAFTIWQGERLDFILVVNQKIGNYWIRYRGYGQCADTSPGVYQTAILRYKGAEITEPTAAVGYQYPFFSNTTRVLNPYNNGSESYIISIPELHGLYSKDKDLPNRVDQQVIIELGFNPLDNYQFHREHLYGYNQVQEAMQIGTFQLNHISLKLPKFPLMSQWEMLKPNSLCNASSVPKTCTMEDCACTHVINVKLNTVVELVFIDRGVNAPPSVNHPLHLHGHFYHVLATEHFDETLTLERFKQLDEEGKIKRKLYKAPLKDTMKTPDKGYSIVRFIPDNPGYWFFHCHFEEHDNIGMALIIKVGEHEDFPKKPDNFPRCGDYLPSVM